MFVSLQRRSHSGGTAKRNRSINDTYMIKKLLFAMVLTAATGCGIMAQSTFGLRVGAGVLYDDFGKTGATGSGAGQQESADRGKSTSVGFSFGAEWGYQIKAVDGLSVVISLDGVYNGPTRELNENFRKEYDRVTGMGVGMTIVKPSFFNFPLMLGAKYSYEPLPGIGIYNAVAAGANLRCTTPITFEYTYSETYGTVHLTYKDVFAPTVTFAFRLSSGILFDERYSVELGYLSLGTGTAESEIRGTASSDAASTESTNKANPMTNTPELFTVSLGITF